MKINFDELAQLAEKSFPIYLIMGDEPLLTDETGQYLKKLARKQGYEEVHNLQLNAQSKWDMLLEQTQSLSLFSNKKIIDLDLPTGAPGKQGGELLSQYAQQPSADVILLVRVPKLTATQQKTKWVSALEQAGVMIQIPAMTREQYPRWLQRRCNRAGLTISTDGLACLAELTEGNLLSAKQAIEKLALLYDKTAISAVEVNTALAESTQYDIYALLESTLKGEQERSLKILVQLKASGVEPTLLIWVYAKEVRQLAILAKAQAAKTLTAQLWQELGIWQQRRTVLTQHLKRNNYQIYLKFIQQLAGLDKISKGALAGNIWDNIQKFVLDFSK